MTRPLFKNPLRQDLFRARHAHAVVLPVLAVVVLRYIDEANLADGWKTMIRLFIPSAGILLPGALTLAVGLFDLGVELVRSRTHS